MKDAQLFERIDQYETTQVSHQRGEPRESAADSAKVAKMTTSPARLWRSAARLANDDARMRRSG
jgi:hypothetical protein